MLQRFTARFSSFETKATAYWCRFRCNPNQHFLAHPFSDSSRCRVCPRSRTHDSWFPLVRESGLSGSWPASRCCRNNVAKRADAALGRKSSAGPERKGHRCGRRRPSSRASDWTAASLVATWWSWPRGPSQRGKAALRRDRRAGSRKSVLTTR